MPAYTDADMRAAVMAAGDRKPCAHEARLALHGERIICDQCDIKAALDAVAPAITARAKAEALREHAADLMAAVADFSEISWERLNNESVARLALNRADEIERATP